MTVTVEIPMTLPSTANLRLHWAAKARLKKAQRTGVAFALKVTHVFDRVPTPRGSGGVWVPSGPLVVTLTRVAPRKLDGDNLQTAFKHVRDAVAAYFGVDDADPRISWRYEQARGPACVRIAFDVVSATEAA